VTGIPGAVFSGSVDGHLRAYSTVNGIPGRGGAIDVAGPVVAGGMLYVVSGNSARGGLPGNVLVAFSADPN
jgi:polyvinyl alcohol dehydrogenase (cytochrome)